ncbi:amidase [Brachionus plicatilis]|uniref:Amidase n=1 Tax=Brachionus plicatilis TaxID=10195 RepID=A0A3M7PIZ8_BRAPC|nr:amidase [Brachionus plicatilis]
MTPYFLVITTWLIFTVNCYPTGLDENFKFSSAQVQNLIQNKKWTCKDVLKYFIDRAVKYDPKIKSIISYNPKAFQRAQQLDDFYAKNGKLIGELHCVPVIIKDNIDIEGIPTTAGVKAMRNMVPNKNALVIERMNQKGAVYLAKANMAQLAAGSIFSSEQVGLCNNPFNLNRTCSASSSGSGASIAAGFAVVSLGTDTGGSIIGPASSMAIWGYRPPHKLEILEGVFPLEVNADTVGPMAKNLDDLILTHSVLYNLTSLYTNTVQKTFDKSPLKVRIITNFINGFKTANFSLVVNPLVANLIKDSVSRMKSLGIQIDEKTLTGSELKDFADKFNDLIKNYNPCIVGCVSFNYNNYFNDKARYESDAPIRNAKQFYQSDLLSSYWKNQIKESGWDVNKLDNLSYTKQLCDQLCQKSIKAREPFKDFVKSNILDDKVDALFVPSLTTIVPLHTEVNQGFKEGEYNTLSVISVQTGYGYVIMPSGFTPQTTTDPDGIPFAMALIHRPEKTENAFKIAKLYEKKKSFYKLPKTVPLLNGINKIKEMNGILIGITVFQFLFFKI